MTEWVTYHMNSCLWNLHRARNILKAVSWQWNSEPYLILENYFGKFSFIDLFKNTKLSELLKLFINGYREILIPFLIFSFVKPCSCFMENCDWDRFYFQYRGEFNKFRILRFPNKMPSNKNAAGCIAFGRAERNGMSNIG